MEIRPIFFKEILFFDFLEESAQVALRQVVTVWEGKIKKTRFFLPKVGLTSILQNSTIKSQIHKAVLGVWMAETRSWTKTREVSSGSLWGRFVYLIVQNIGVVSNVIVVLLGFGAVVLVHEFGHFITAKLGGIKVEAFSIFMPPTMLGIRRTTVGVQVPRSAGLLRPQGGGIAPRDDDATEYRIGLFPFGGYVKLLGQEDTGPVKQNDDPRSFARKPISIRMAVIAAGVIFNVISAAIIFMVVFLVASI